MEALSPEARHRERASVGNVGGPKDLSGVLAEEFDVERELVSWDVMKADHHLSGSRAWISRSRSGVVCFSQSNAVDAKRVRQATNKSHRRAIMVCDPLQGVQ